MRVLPAQAPIHPERLPIEVLRNWTVEQPRKRVFEFAADDSTDRLGVLTYETLDLRARAVATRLSRLGLVGERALLHFSPGLDFIVAFYGCLYAGVVAVPTAPGHPNRPSERLRSILADARPRIVLISSESAPRAADLDGLARLALDEVDEAGASDWIDPRPGRDSLAFLQYTSGSTASPKGVMITHGNIAHNSSAIAGCFGTDRETHGVSWLPPHHDMGLIGGILQTVHCGGSSTLLSPSAFLRRPLLWLELIAATKASISGGPNFAYSLCARKADPARLEGLDLSCWRVAFNGAEPLRAETLDGFAKAFEPAGFRREAFLPCYGMAETTLLVAGGPWPEVPVVVEADAASLEAGEITLVEGSASSVESSTRPLVGSGRVVAGMDIVVVDPATGTPRSSGQVGEIWVSGPSVASGYWNRPEATSEVFGARPAGGASGTYLRTGDLGFRLGDELFVTGRLKDLIIINGRNVYPQDLEWAAQQAHPALKADGGAAFSVEVGGQERLILVHELERHAKADVDKIVLAIRRALVEQWDVVAHAVALIRPMSLPRTSSGKVRRSAARDQFQDGTLDLIARSDLQLDTTDDPHATEPEPGPIAARPRAEIRDWLRSRLGRTMGMPPSRVDPRREFASFGLGSVQAASLASDLELWLGRTVPPTLVYDYPTIDALAAHLAGETASATHEDLPRRADRDEPIAIIGIGCRFPRADGPEGFWRLLSEGGDAVGEWPADRPGGRTGLRGGFLNGIDQFDADFFEITAREAARLDPQHRLLLEIAWEALEDAGVAPRPLAGSPVGVFVGISTNDYAILQVGRGGPGAAHALTGNAATMAANRISYAFDFRGPSLSIDSACSSSLAAVHLACRSLRSGEANLALAGGVNLVLSSEVWDQFAAAGFLAPDGRCKAFDARADGYVRGEGAALVVLKPLAAARADGDRIYAVIRGGAINQDGRTNGLTAPSRWSQETVIAAACRDAGIEPAALDYVEAHGTGTLLGDPIEASALGAVVGRGRPVDRPCVIGSAKTNIGHLEAAAGVAGLIKVALSLDHRAIPPSLHFDEPNPLIPFEGLRLRVARGLEPWPTGDGPPLAGVSSFGFGGSNAHLVLEGSDRFEAATPRAEATTAVLIPISGRTVEALEQVARSYRDLLADPAAPPLTDLAAAAAHRRGHHDHRMALLVESKAQAIETLDAWLGGEHRPNLWIGGSPAPEVSATAAIGQDHPASVAARYVAGDDVDWREHYPTSRFVKLPAHPWNRQRFWFDGDEGPGSETRALVDESTPTPSSLAADETPDWRALPEAERQAWLVGFLRATVARSMSLAIDEVEADSPLDELGLDSLTAFDIKWAVDRGLGLSLPMTRLVEGMSVTNLADAIAAMVDPTTEPGQAVPAIGDLEDQPVGGSPDVDRDRRRAFPASSSQARLWFLDQLEPGNPAYNIASALRLTGELDVAALERSLDEIVDRHEILRTTFEVVDGRPVQVVAETRKVRLPVTDLSDLPALIREREVESRTSEEASKPFDLAEGPLLRVGLLRLGAVEHVVAFNLHHIITDGLSMAILIRELAQLYDAHRRGVGSPLTVPPLQYRDFAAWQAERLAAGTDRAGVDYWRSKLEGLPVLELATDRPRPASPTRRAGHRRVTLPRSLFEAATELGRSVGATPFMTFLAAFKALLHRHAGQADIAVGIPVAGRPRSEFAEMIGLFVNSLVLRTDLSHDPDFREVLARVRRTALEAYSHQDVPYEQVVGSLRSDRASGDSPLFGVMFVYQQDPLRELRVPGLTLVPIEVDAVAAKFDLTLFATETEGGLRLALEYDADLFDGSTVDRMLAHYRTLLEAVVRSPRRPIAGLPILAAAERHMLLNKWNATRGEPSTHATVQELFHEQAIRFPGAVAVKSGDLTLTYRELDEQSNRLAHHLRGEGVGPEVIVGVCLPRSLELVVGLLGVLKAGGAYLPIDPTYPSARIGEMLADSGASILLTNSALSARIDGDRPGPRLILADGGWSVAGDSPTNEPASGVGADNLAYVIYTSGSTGRPKGAMIVHRGLMNYLNWCTKAYRTVEGRGAPVHSSISFDLTVTSLYAPLLSGGRVDLLAEDLGIEALAEALRQQGDYSLVKITPAHLQLLGQQLDPAEAAGRTRAFIVGGEQLTDEHLAFWRSNAPETVIINEYGPTETVVGCCIHRVDFDDTTQGALPIGRPIANTRLYVLDARMQPTPLGVPGELFIGGDSVARGYLGRPSLTAERFVPDPFGPAGGRLYRSGDRARWRADGQLEFLGRADDQVKIRGYRVELGEVEAALARQPDVREAAVVARDDGFGDRRLIGYMSAEPGRSIDTSSLRRDLLRSLPGYMVPSSLVVLPSLPLTTNGKVDRGALPEPDTTRDVDRDDEASGPIEETLCRIVADVLKLEFVAAHENLFDLGIDSILVIQVVSKARQAGLRLQPGQVFKHQSVAELARVVESFDLIPLEQGPVVGPVRLTPIQRWFFERELDHPEHYNLSVLLEIPRELDADRLEQALKILAEHHDALRLRFSRDGSGWSQQLAAPGDRGVSLDRIDFSGLGDSELRESLEVASSRIQASMNLEDGPIFRAVLFDLGAGRGGRLLLAVHHLAVDGVSWRILLEDLATLLGQFEGGARPTLPPKTTSVLRWAEALERESRSPSTTAELEFWLSQRRSVVAPLPIDHEIGRDPGVESTADEVAIELDADWTRALLQEVPRAFNSQINDVLLAALAAALGEWSGGDSVLIDLEGHGREAISDGVDLSRTVGWFTTIVPIGLTLPADRDPAALVRSVKEQLRRIPRRGIGYGLLRYLNHSDQALPLRSAPPADVLFNYLGQIDQASSTNGPGVALAAESTGPTRSPLNRRSHLIDINGFIADRRLQFRWAFNGRAHRRETIERVAAGFAEGLRAIVEAARSPEVRGYVPSDFPLAGLGQSTLDRAFAGEPGIEDVYPASPMQTGMLFDVAYAEGSRTYVQQWTCKLLGNFDARAFADAWRRVVGRHPALRTSFRWVDADLPMQVVHRQVELPLVEVDWRGLPGREQDRRLGEFLEADRDRGFVMSWAPLLRLGLVRLGPDSAIAVLTFHHAILDGWCMPILFDEVLTLYRAGQVGVEASLPARRPYREFIAWVLGRDSKSSESYWRDLLKGFRDPTPLAIDRPGSNRVAQAARGETIVKLAEGPTSALNTLVRVGHLTLNTVVQGAWAILLARYSGQPDVVFGATVSGRQADLDGVETMIGLFINTLPTRVAVDDEAMLIPWLEAIQERQACSRAHENTPLVEIHGFSEIPRGRPLFESILVFENYPSEIDLGGLPGGLRFEPARVYEETNFPLTLMVGPGAELTLRADYDAARFDAAAIERLLDRLRTLLEEMAIDSRRRLADLPMIGPAEQERLLGLARSGDDSGVEGSPGELDEQDESQLDLLLLRLAEETGLDP